jgi:hypothetical protein
MASILKVDALQGVTSAGSITVTSEGGSATQSLQQGLAKAWVQTASGAAPSGSLNISGVVDNATGNYTVSFSSAMANDDYSPTVAKITPGAGRDVGFLSNATTNVVIYSSTTSSTEDATCFSTVHGDLA